MRGFGVPPGQGERSLESRLLFVKPYFALQLPFSRADRLPPEVASLTR